MFDPKLFLGIPQTPQLKKVLETTNPHLLALLNLTPIEQSGSTYLGKEVPTFANLEQLSNLESHLTSLIKRVAPHYTPESTHLICTLPDM